MRARRRIENLWMLNWHKECVCKQDVKHTTEWLVGCWWKRERERRRVSETKWGKKIVWKKSQVKSSFNLEAIKILLAIADQCLIKRSNCLSNSLILCDYIFSTIIFKTFILKFLNGFFFILQKRQNRGDYNGTQ